MARKASSKSKFSTSLIVILFLILFASITGFLFFTHQSAKEAAKAVEIKIAGPEELKMGQENIFIVKIDNQYKQDLEEPELTVTFPSGFYLQEALPDCSDRLAAGCIWRFDLPKKKSIEIKVGGQFFSEPGEKKVVNALLNFRLPNLSSDFQKEASLEIMAEGPIIDLAVKGPPASGSPADGLSWEINLKNIARREISGLKVRVLFPEDFVFQDEDPPLWQTATNTEKFCLVDFSKKDSERKVFFKGNFLSLDQEGLSAEEAELKMFLVDVSLPGPDGKYWVQDQEGIQLKTKN